MAKKEKLPITPAVRQLREHHVSFTPHLYRYEERGGSKRSSEELGVDEHIVIKTLIMEDEAHEPLVVLMHGDRQVNTGELARQLGKKTITPCDPATASKHSGYLVGGTSPFGLKRAMPIHIERSIEALDTIYINGGKRGFLVSLPVSALLAILDPVRVDVAV